jgi:hypothetical protein
MGNSAFLWNFAKFCENHKISIRILISGDFHHFPGCAPGNTPPETIGLTMKMVGLARRGPRSTI